MDHIDAIYQQGVFKPLTPVSFQEDQRVRLHVDTTPKESVEAWLERVRAHQKAIRDRVGTLPDSTPGIASDRLR